MSLFDRNRLRRVAMLGNPLPHDLARVLRWCGQAIIATGAAQVGGYPGVSGELRSVPAAARDWAPRRDRRVEREAVRGIAEIERFLDHQPRS